MRFKPDWIYLRPSLIVMGMALLFAVVLKMIGYGYLNEMTLRYQQTNAEHNGAQSRLSELQEDGKIITGYREKFSLLERAGLFDSKKRVEWVDAVNSVRNKMKLPLVRYQISPQSEFQPSYLPVDEYISVMSSNIRFEAGLLHEDDLVDLFAWMARYVPGQLHLSACELNRSEEYFGYYADRSNLNVICDLNWLTIAPRLQEASQ